MELVATRSVVEGEVRRALASQRGNKRNSVLLLRADAQWRDDSESRWTSTASRSR